MHLEAAHRCTANSINSETFFPLSCHSNGHAKARPYSNGHAKARPYSIGHAKARPYSNGHAKMRPYSSRVTST